MKSHEFEELLKQKENTHLDFKIEEYDIFSKKT